MEKYDNDLFVLSFNAKRKDERKGAQKEKLMALLPTGLPEQGPKAINFTPFWVFQRAPKVAHYSY